MKPTNEMPDEIFVNAANGTDCPAKTSDSGCKYIRHGAPTPFINPKVQPIPEGLDGNQILWIQYRIALMDRTIRHSVNAALARNMAADGRLLGYIILPPEELE